MQWLPLMLICVGSLIYYIRAYLNDLPISKLNVRICGGLVLLGLAWLWLEPLVMSQLI